MKAGSTEKDKFENGREMLSTQIAGIDIQIPFKFAVLSAICAGKGDYYVLTLHTPSPLEDQASTKVEQKVEENLPDQILGKGLVLKAAGTHCAPKISFFPIKEWLLVNKVNKNSQEIRFFKSILI